MNNCEPILLWTLGAPRSLTGTLVKTSIASFTLKGGTMGPNDCIEIWSLWSHTNSANIKLENVAFGSATVVGANVTANDSLNRPQWIWNRNALNSQVYYPSGQLTGTGNTSGVPATTSQDTNNNVLIDFLGTLLDTGEVITLEGAHIKWRRFL
jgi:hypothetical protein